MEIGDLPAFLLIEILTLIARYVQDRVPNNIFVDRKSIKCLRLTCKAFESAASPYLLERLWISTRDEDCQRMETVSNHPIFSQYVDTIAYDFTSYESFLAQNQKIYEEALGDENEPTEYNWAYARQKGSLRTEISLDAKRLGWERYRYEFATQLLAP